MKRALLLSLTLHLLGGISPGQLSSANNISFQGALTGANNQPLPNRNYHLNFRFWDGPAPGGDPVSTNITVPNVPVAGGVATTAIPVDPAWFNGQTRYLGVSANGGSELLPRVLVTAVPYALKANKVGDSNGNLLLEGWVQAERGIYATGPTTGNFAFVGGYREGTFANWLGLGPVVDCYRRKPGRRLRNGSGFGH